MGQDGDQKDLRALVYLRYPNNRHGWFRIQEVYTSLAAQGVDVSEMPVTLVADRAQAAAAVPVRLHIL